MMEVILPNNVKSLLATCLAAGSLALVAPAMAADAPANGGGGSGCFFVTQWDGGWRSPSPDVIYIKVNLNDVYRLDLSGGSPQLLDPSVHLVNVVRGSNSICSALDFDLSVSDYHGFRTPLIVKSMRKLSPAEIAAIPPKFRP
jgi:hypothetical protein